MVKVGFSIVGAILVLGIGVSAVAAARKAAGDLRERTDPVEYRVPTTFGGVYCDLERASAC